MKTTWLFLAGIIFSGLWAIQGIAQNSVLSDGDWFKLTTSESGIYKIGYSDLQSYGIDPSQINPKMLAIYGNGNGTLSEDPEAPRPDDLIENAIFVSGEEDEVFDPQDYILFYGEGPTEWNFDDVTGFFTHETNIYTDVSCYFLTVGNEPGMRIEEQYSTILPFNHTSNTGDGYMVHEEELVNLIHSGKQWAGEAFDENTKMSFSVNLQDPVDNEPVYLHASAIARSTELSHLNFLIDNTPFVTMNIAPVSYPSITFARQTYQLSSFYPDNPEFELTINYDKPTDSSLAWLDYFVFNYRRQLNFTGGQMPFRDIESVGSGMVTQFKVHTGSNDLKIWNITKSLKPLQVEFEYSTNTASFVLKTDSLLEFITFDESQLLQPEFAGEVLNQNLHALDPPDLLIVAADDFMTAAQQLASFRQTNNGLSTLVVSPQQIYNEFSSGMQDVTAIRDFYKYLHDKDNSGELPGYLLLFGKASYDYKDRITNNTNFVPVWETLESLNRIDSYGSDDFFSIIPSELYQDYPLAGTGRIPVKTATEAAAVVQKLIDYETSVQATGSWRNNICFIADDEDFNIHFHDSEELSTIADTTDPSMNISKIYLDAFQQMVAPNGTQTYPAVNAAITQKINDGTLMMVYTGHSSETELAYEKIITPGDLGNWQNYSNFPFMFGLTGGMNKFDDPDLISLGERMVVSGNKGMAAVLAPTASSYAGTNSVLSVTMLIRIFTSNDQSIGKSLKEVKTQNSFSSNIKKYTILGDPSMRLAIPLFSVETETINGIPVEEFDDTISPGGQIILTGKIMDQEGFILQDFNGNLEAKLFDRPKIRSTLGNDATSYVEDFTVQDSILSETVTAVENGEFNLTISIPLNLNETYGPLKLSYYAIDGLVDAQGSLNLMAGGPASAVEEFNTTDALLVYPTMNEGIIEIEFKKDFPQLILETFEITGKQVQSIELNQIKCGEYYQLNLTDQPPGLYILRITDGSQTRSFKLMKK